MGGRAMERKTAVTREETLVTLLMVAVAIVLTVFL